MNEVAWRKRRLTIVGLGLLMLAPRVAAKVCPPANGDSFFLCGRAPSENLRRRRFDRAGRGAYDRRFLS